MAKNIEHIQHIKSNVVENGIPKLPNPSALTEGEITINYAEGYETISIKNSSGDIKTFSSDEYYTEKKLGSAFTDANSAVTVTEAIENSEEVAISSGVTPVGGSIELWVDESVDPAVADVYTKAQTDDLLDKKADSSAYTELWVSGTGANAVVLKGGNNVASGHYSVAEGQSTVASGISSHAEGIGTHALGANTHAEGQGTYAHGHYSHVEGTGTQASGQSSHAEGNYTNATGDYSHAEGVGTTSSGLSSHAEGQSSQANGMSSHAEGTATQANKNYSHAEGYYTEANNQSEHASGQYNVSSSASTTFGDSGNTLFSVGNGTADDARHNAFEIRQNGDIYIINKNGQDVKLQDEIGNITIDQTIDSGTSASTNAVSTSAVYGFVTSYTPSITVDQVLDNTTSASTNPVSSKAVYDAVTDNELVWTMAYTALSGAVSSHTEDTTIHVTSSDKMAWNNAATNSHSHNNKSTLDAITASSTAINSLTGAVGTMAFQNASSYSSATQVSTALTNKVDIDAFPISSLSISTNTSSECSITGSSNAGKIQTIIYINSGSSDVTVTVPTIYQTPDGAAIELTCPSRWLLRSILFEYWWYYLFSWYIIVAFAWFIGFIFAIGKEIYDEWKYKGSDEKDWTADIVGITRGCLFSLILTI